MELHIPTIMVDSYPSAPLLFKKVLINLIQLMLMLFWSTFRMSNILRSIIVKPMHIG